MIGLVLNQSYMHLDGVLRDVQPTLPDISKGAQATIKHNNHLNLLKWLFVRGQTPE